jgi:hypothetical protein
MNRTPPEAAMGTVPKKRDPLAEACELVGCFLYHFSRMEQRLDCALIKILELDEDVAPVITANIDFAKKANLVRTAAAHQLKKSPHLPSVQGMFKRVYAMNDARTIVAHCAFEPASGGAVQFKRTQAKDGKIRTKDPKWTKEEFAKACHDLQALDMELIDHVTKVRPVASQGDLFEQFFKESYGSMRDDYYRNLYMLRLLGYKGDYWAYSQRGMHKKTIR